MNKANEQLPAWSLLDLYEGPDSKALANDLALALPRAKDFHDRFQGRLDKLSGTELGLAIGEYEAIGECLGKAASYAYLCFAADIANPATGRFLQEIKEQTTDISANTLFFTLELNRIGDEILKAQLAAPEAARYRPWIENIRDFRPHQLANDLEKLLHEKSPCGSSAWVRLYDETLAHLRFKVNGKSLNLADTLDLMSDNDQSLRRKAAKAMGKSLKGEIRLFTLISNTLAKDKAVNDRWRNYRSPVSERNLENQVEGKVVEALAGSVRSSYPNLAHRYYRLKAKWFGVKVLDYWDRNAPLPGDNKRYSWAEASGLVLDAYSAFSPAMADLARRFFDNHWIDAALRQGKDSGAFSHPTVPSVHPYILMNFHGKAKDVMTLAHELGHGVHQLLSASQGALMMDTPLTLAETASVFGEMLAFCAMLNQENSQKRRRILLASKVEDMLNTVVRQIAFHDFETKIHDRRKIGELSNDDFCDIWMETQAASLGPAIRLDQGYRNFWAYISHFTHAPFYVYAYAFGDCLANSLYEVYRQGPDGFVDKYLDLLKAGGTIRRRQLLAPFGLDASDEAFWRRGLNVISSFIDELEGMP